MEEEQKVIQNPTQKRFRTVDIAVAGVIASAYAVLTVLGSGISFGAINLRFANALIGLVPIFGWPAVFGISLGVFLGNLLGAPLGPLDIFLSPIFSFIGLVAMQKLRKKSVLAGLLVYSLILSLWVTYMLNFYLGLAYFPLYYAIFAGIAIMVMGLAYFVYKALVRAGLKKRIQSVFPE